MTCEELQLRRQRYVIRIRDNEEKIRSLEKSHESLTVFKGTVGRSQEEFHGVNHARAKFLAAVAEVSQNSRTAQKYHKGMSHLFSRIGACFVNLVYVVLLQTISTRLCDYVNRINDCDEDISYCRRQIRELDIQIRESKQQEASAAMGGQI